MNIQDFGNISFEQIADHPECWIVRGHPELDGFGGVYDWSFVMIRENTKGIIKGLVSDNMLTSSHTKTIREFLRLNDMTHVEFTRKRDRGETKHRLK